MSSMRPSDARAHVDLRPDHSEMQRMANSKPSVYSHTGAIRRETTSCGGSGGYIEQEQDSSSEFGTALSKRDIRKAENDAISCEPGKPRWNLGRWLWQAKQRRPEERTSSSIIHSRAIHGGHKSATDVAIAGSTSPGTAADGGDATSTTDAAVSGDAGCPTSGMAPCTTASKRVHGDPSLSDSSERRRRP